LLVDFWAVPALVLVAVPALVLVGWVQVMFLALAIELVPALVPVVVLVNLIVLVLVPAQEWVLGRVVVVGQVQDWFVELARIGVLAVVVVLGQVRG
jgi:hypothetical protein